MKSGNQQSAIRSRAFTMVEILVIVGIIGLLVGMLLPSMSRFIIAARKARSQATIHLIDGACKYYFNDFEDYPPSSDATYSGWYGSQLAVLFLAGYGPDWKTKGVPYEEDRNLAEDDGNEGYGFRTVRRGRVYGPYNGVEKAKVHGEDRPEFVDEFGRFGGNPIAYYRHTGSNYNASHNNGPDSGDLNRYTLSGGGMRYRTDFILISRGANCEWNVPRDGDSDDITNFHTEF